MQTRKTSPQTTPANADVAARIRRIAAARNEITRLLNEVGARVRAAEIECDADAEALRRMVRADRTGATAKAVADGFTRERIDTGSLGSRLIDEVEARGPRAFPPPYEVEKPRWAIVEAR